MLLEKRWVNWRFEQRSGDKPTKVPYQPNGDHAKTNDASTWSERRDLVPGMFVGFVLGDGWWGVDLDNSRGQAWEADIISRFPAAYIEVSPSGKGVKLFCRGNDQVKGRKKAIGEGAIEVYGAGRYFAVTGEAIQEGEPGDCSAGLAWLLEKHFPSEPKATPSPKPQTPIEERVSKYLAKIPGAVSGCGGHNHTFHVAGQLVHGFALAVEAALPMFQAWNATCQPPWSDAELERKLHQAAKATCDKPRGWLLNESNDWAEAASGVDLSGLDNPKPAAEPASRPRKPGRLPASVFNELPGILKEVVDYNLATALYPQPEIALAGALALVSTLTGRKVTDTYNTRTNLYVIALAETGAGKNHSRSLNRKILIRAGCPILEGPEEFASSAGIVSSLVEHPCRLLQIDEAGDIFGTIRAAGAKAQHLAGILRVLKTLYTSADCEFKAGGYARVEQNKIIDQPSLTMYGCGTEKFWDSISPKVVEDGTLGRILIVGPCSAIQYKGRPPIIPLPDSILDYARRWFAWTPGGLLAQEHPEPAIAKHSPEAEKRIEDHITEISRRSLAEKGDQRHIWMRTAEKTNKLALIFACSRLKRPDDGVSVSIEDVELAIKVSNWSTRQAIAEVFDCVYETEREKIVKRILKMCEEPRTKTYIIRHTQGLAKRLRDDVMQEMLECNSIGTTVAETAGRPSTSFVRL